MIPGKLMPFLLSMFGAIVVTTGAIIGVPNACSAIGGCFVPASRAWVRDENSPLHLAQAQTSASVDRQLKFQLEQALREARKDPALPNSPALQTYVGDLEKQKAEADARIDASDAQVRQLQQKR